MADVTGPISTLPGSCHSLPDDTMCDYHPDRPAVARYQGETDSFGCEMHDICAECLKKFREAARSPDARTGQCEWCKGEATDLRPRRDIDEGMYGRVYDVCGACAKRDEDALARELAEHDAEFDYDGDYED